MLEVIMVIFGKIVLEQERMDVGLKVSNHNRFLEILNKSAYLRNSSLQKFLIVMKF